MEIGIDCFAGMGDGLDKRSAVNRAQSIEQLLDRIELADKVGLDVFGVGEHYREESLDSATSVILSAAAARTKNIRLTSAVTVLSSVDPVRSFQQYSTLDLISKGRAEMVVGRGSFTESFPLFGYDLKDYDALFLEKLKLLLELRNKETVNWSGQFRAPLVEQGVYPRPFQKEMPIWLGVGGSPGSFVRAGELGLPLMVAVIGGETFRFRPLVDLYRNAYIKAGHNVLDMKVGLHSPGFVAVDGNGAIEDFFPGYLKMFNKIGRERGWGPITRAHFDDQVKPEGAFVIGNPDQVAEKLIRHAKALGGISRFTFQMDNPGLSHEQLTKAIELIGTKVKPLLDGY